MANEIQTQTTQQPTESTNQAPPFLTSLQWGWLAFWFPKSVPFIVATLFLLIPYLWVFGSWGFAKNSQEWANFATYYTGIISPVITALGLYYIIQTFQLQRKQLAQVEKQTKDSNDMLSNQLNEMQEQTKIARQNMEKQLDEMEKQRSFGLVLSSLDAITNIINLKIKEVFDKGHMGYMNYMNEKGNYQSLEANNIQDFCMYFDKNSIRYPKNNIDCYEQFNTTELYNIKNIFDILNNFVKYVVELPNLKIYEKFYLNNLILQGKLAEVTKIANDIISQQEEQKKGYIENADYDNDTRKIIGLESVEVGFEEFIKTLQTFLTLTSTGEAENETITT